MDIKYSGNTLPIKVHLKTERSSVSKPEATICLYLCWLGRNWHWSLALLCWSLCHSLLAQGLKNRKWVAFMFNLSSYLLTSVGSEAIIVFWSHYGLLKPLWSSEAIMVFWSHYGLLKPLWSSDVSTTLRTISLILLSRRVRCRLFVWLQENAAVVSTPDEDTRWSISNARRWWSGHQVLEETIYLSTVKCTTFRATSFNAKRHETNCSQRPLRFV